MKELQKTGIRFIDKGLQLGIMGMNVNRLFEALERDWIEENTQKAYQKIHGIDCCGSCCEKPSELQQILYASYAGMFKYLYHTMKLGKLMVERFDHQSKQFVSHEYNKEKDGLAPFGLDRLKVNINFDASKDLPEKGICAVWIPTKKVAYPKITLEYDDESSVR